MLAGELLQQSGGLGVTLGERDTRIRVLRVPAGCTAPPPPPPPPPPPAPPPPAAALRASNRWSPSAPNPSCSAWLAAVLGTPRVTAAVPRSRNPSRCATAPASTAGIMRRTAKGTNVAIRRSAPPASTDEKPEPCDPEPAVPEEMAPAARLRVATMTNFEMIKAANVSTSRRHQCETAGHTRVASARGRKSTAT
jgi:hypothetical protein